MNVIAYQKEADISKHFYFVHFPDMKAAKYKFADEHIHHSIELLFCYDGEMEAKINKDVINLKSGDLLIINSLDWHFYKYINNAACYILVISHDYFDDILSDPQHEFNNKISLDKNETQEVLNLLEEAYRNFDEASFLSKKSFVLNFFSKLESKNLFRKKEISHSRSFCKNVISYVENNYSQKLTIDSIAVEFGYSRNYFSHLFNRLMGENFKTFLNRYRCKKVDEIRKNNPNMLVEEAICKCGFSSRETYYRFLRNTR